MKKPVMSLMLVVAAAPAVPAEPAATTVDRLVACSDLHDAGERLACFDREVAPLASARSTRAGPVAVQPVAPPVLQPATPSPGAAAAPAVVAQAPVAVAPPPATTQPATTPSFGEEQLGVKQRPPAAGEAPSLHARITKLRDAGGGQYLVNLDNGQVWRHEDSYLGAYLKEGDAITIRKSALGSYRLTRDEGEAKNWIRVSRVR